MKDGKKGVYVAGPMRGYPDFNFPAFIERAKILREQGYFVFNPAERDIALHGENLSPSGSIEEAAQKGFSLREALRDDTNFICMDADAIFMLRGWERSKGATAERALAEALGHEIWYE